MAFEPAAVEACFHATLASSRVSKGPRTWAALVSVLKARQLYSPPTTQNRSVVILISAYANWPIVLWTPPAFRAASPAKYSLWSSPMSEPDMFWCFTQAMPWRISWRWTFLT